jgi:hypothetical protein
LGWAPKGASQAPRKTPTSTANDNIELVRHALDVYNTGDVDAFVDLFTDDCEL